MSVPDVGASDRRELGQPDDVVTMPTMPTMRHDDAMEIALTQARAALEHDDVPVGAIVVCNGDVIAARHNERELHDDPVAHAEILALRDAAAHLGQWRLEDCTMYVTLEPCPMCAGALVNARLSRLVYGAHDPKAGAVTSQFELLSGERLNHRVEVTSGVRASESAELLRAFFRLRRSSKVDDSP
jgi:tRNA(adenine34) deaminase